MRKKFIAVLSVLALLIGTGGLVLGARAASTAVYILAVNDKFADLSVSPEAVNGVIYIPYTVFDKDATGEDLGVYYGIRQDRELGSVLNLYSLGGILTFAVNQGSCTDGDGNSMNFRAVIRNGITYVPANAVCSFFGLQYSFLPTTDRGILIRICSSSATLSNSVFLSAGSSGMLSRYNAILQSMEPDPFPTPTPRPTATPAPTETPFVPGTKEHVTVYLAVDASVARHDILDLFPDSYRLLLLFSPDSMKTQAPLIRKAVAQGHSVGILVSGTAQEALEQARQGNRLLSHIARIQTRILSAPDGIRDELWAQGWLCWRSDVTGSTAGALLANLATRWSSARLTLPAQADLIRQVVSRLRSDGYTVRQPLETTM